MTESNVAQDQIKAYVDRILRMKEEAKAINADIREIYAEAKGNGFDKTVLGKLVTYVEKRQTDASAVLETEALFDLYLTAYDGAVGKVGTKRATHTHAPEKPDPIAAIKADPAMAIVDPSNLKNKSEPQPTKAAGQAPATPDVRSAPSDGFNASLPGAEGAEDRDQITEPQPGPQAGSDLTNSQALNGQVATHSPETADEIHERASTDDEASPEAGPQAEASPSREQVAGTLADREARHEGQGAPASLPTPKYAAPGIVTYENHPPEGVERSAISFAFANMGQDGALIQDELANGRAQPIVKQGKVILDGWARYMTARTMTELDGSPLTYAVVQYDGTDPLIDIIRLNVEGRMLNEQQKRVIAQTLTRQNPKRKDDIYRAFELWMEPV